MLTVEITDPGGDGPRTLLAQHHAYLRSKFALEENHFLDLDALRAPHIRFFAAREGAQTLGIGALMLAADYGEVKSMFTAPAVRGKGVADAILRAIIDQSVAENRPILRLETGTGLDAAHRLYARHGFAPRGPFGGYIESPASLFLERIPPGLT